ncbi:MAG TPA: DegT/DnrJ/EryC1/StrS family aminotransferase, partial [Acidimicrobiia bacterium]|nr:DegT/DnrJ/EryC1/StrS family aminotransferase [Acidimicrobiia bacterium]
PTMTMAPDDIPFLELAAQHAEIAEALDEAWATVSASNGFIGGTYVADFEATFARYCGVAECVGVANGTDALELILRGLGFGRGDEIIVPANTFVATVEAVVTVGATPVFVDVDDETLVVTAAAIEAAITDRTAAAIIVHLYGQMPDMDAIGEVTDRAGIALVEDAAQAHGARWLDRRAGSFGRAAAFSFYPGKNLGAFGDAGAVTTDDTDLSDTIRSLADHGRRIGTRHEHEVSGRNSRLDALQAAVLSIKLARLDDWNSSRRAAADQYRKLLDATNCRVLQSDPRSTPVHHLEVVRVPNRTQVLRALDAHRIGWGLHYPVPTHRQRPFQRFAQSPCPVTERAATEIISVPMFPTIAAHQIERVCEVLVTATQGSVCGTS